jgi:hypothetical protein
MFFFEYTYLYYRESMKITCILLNKFSNHSYNKYNKINNNTQNKIKTTNLYKINMSKKTIYSNRKRERERRNQ